MGFLVSIPSGLWGVRLWEHGYGEHGYGELRGARLWEHGLKVYNRFIKGL